MTSKENAAIVFVFLLVGFLIGLVLVLGDQRRPSDVWTPQTIEEPVPTGAGP